MKRIIPITLTLSALLSLQVMSSAVQAQESADEKSSVISMLIPERENTETASTQQAVKSSRKESKKPALENTFLKKLKNARACCAAGKEFLELGQYAQAELVFLKADCLKPNNPEILNYLGKTYIGKRQYDKASIYLKKSISMNRMPYVAIAYYDLGEVSFEHGDLKGAMDNYRKAIKLNPALKNRKRPFYLGDLVRKVNY